MVQLIKSHEITGLILAGGQGSRVGGKDKGLLCYQGEPLIESAIACLKPQVDHIVISANRNIGRYQSYGFPVITDAMSGFQGPLAGVLAALTKINSPLLAVVPVDGVKFPNDLVSRLLEGLVLTETNEIAYAGGSDRDHYLHALLKISVETSLQHYLASAERSVRGWYALRRAARVGFPSTAVFRNLNEIK